MINEKCNKILDLWTFGLDGFCQPDYKAKRFGKGKTTWVSIQYHWNNPEEISGYTGGCEELNDALNVHPDMF